MMQPVTSFVLVHLQRVEAMSIYTAPIETAFRDVEALFRSWIDRPLAFETLYLAPLLATDPLRQQPRIDWAKTEQLLRTDDWWGGPRGRVFKVEQQELLPKVRALIHADETTRVVVLVGANIVAPPSWSFALWDILDSHNAIVSLNPMNPLYWGFKESGERMERVKQISTRARAAVCSVVGRMLELKGCSNPKCFLREPIDAIDELDEMREIGLEHGYPAHLNITLEGHVAQLEPEVLEGDSDPDVGLESL